MQTSQIANANILHNYTRCICEHLSLTNHSEQYLFMTLDNLPKSHLFIKRRSRDFFCIGSLNQLPTYRVRFSLFQKNLLHSSEFIPRSTRKRLSFHHHHLLDGSPIFLPRTVASAFVGWFGYSSSS